MAASETPMPRCGKFVPKQTWANQTSTKSAHTALAVKACLLGCNSATLNAQVTFVYIAVAISALAGGGGPFKIFAPKPFLCWCFRIFSDDFWALDLKRILRWNFGSFWGGSGNRKNGLGRLPATEKRTTMKKNCKYSCFQRIWDARVLNTLQKLVFWTNFILKNA